MLEQLDEKIMLCDAAHDDCLKQGKLLDSLKCLEASCSLKFDRHDQLGTGIEDVDRGYQALVTEYNTTAMLSLQVLGFECFAILFSPMISTKVRIES